jgi:D-mannonate dehydratase
VMAAAPIGDQQRLRCGEHTFWPGHGPEIADSLSVQPGYCQADAAPS